MPNIDAVNVHSLTKLCEYMLDGEPVFIIRAQDIASPAGIQGYIVATRSLGGKNTIRSQRKLEEIKKWQDENINKVKAAD